MWTWEDDVSDIMLSGVTFNFTGGKKILFFTVMTMFTEHEFRDVETESNDSVSLPWTNLS